MSETSPARDPASDVAAAFRPPPADAAWRQFDIALTREAGGAVASARALFGTLAPVLRGDGGERACGWFFMRKPPDVRLRVLLTPGTGRVLAGTLAGRLADLRDAGAIHGYSAGRYVPEEDRFGGPGGMALAHGYFHADSMLWLAVGPCGGYPLAPEVLLPALLDDLFRRCGGPAGALGAWRALAAEIAAGTGRAATAATNRPARLGSLADATPSAADALHAYSLANRTYAERLRGLAPDGRSPAEIAATLGLFSLNRHGVAGHTSGPLAAAAIEALTAGRPL